MGTPLRARLNSTMVQVAYEFDWQQVTKSIGDQAQMTVSVEALKFLSLRVT